MNAKQLAIEACSCPSTTDSVKPLCQAEQLLSGNTDYPLLFVRAPKGLYCKHLLGFGNGHFCTCKERLELFKRYNI